MNGPYGFELHEDCTTCKSRCNGFFCQLPAEALKDLDAIKFVSAYPQGAILFMEKQASRGVYILCEGELKLSVSSSEGKTLILRIAKPGDVLGLTAVLSGKPYELTAEVIRPCQVAFIRGDAFLRFLVQHPEAYQAVIRQLSLSYNSACEQLRTVGLSASAPERLAKLLLEFSAGGKESKVGTRVTLPLTHSEMAEFIGTTRETVTRTLSDFKTRHLVDVHGSTLTIQNRTKLQDMVTA